jgi:hypothetical protein
VPSLPRDRFLNTQSNTGNTSKFLSLSLLSLCLVSGVLYSNFSNLYSDFRPARGHRGGGAGGARRSPVLAPGVSTLVTLSRDKTQGHLDKDVQADWFVPVVYARESRDRYRTASSRRGGRGSELSFFPQHIASPGSTC